MNEQEPSSNPNDSRKPLSVWRALVVGWLLVNIPVIVIMLGILLIGIAIGFFLGWTWWSFTIARWRKWAINRGAPPARLQRWAVAVGLTWPKGWVLEKTEIRPDE
jgi:hypothetical protein